MKRTKGLIVFSFLLFSSIFGIIFIDLAGVFSFSDIPFFLSIILITFFFVIQRFSSKMPFLLSLYFLIIMGLSYIISGVGYITERLGEWFYIYFLIGLIQYTVESHWEKALR